VARAASIAKDDQILCEHYQYGRTDRDRFLSQSMAKSITAMLIGIAIGEGAIKSVYDPAETYVPGVKDTVYGKTPIRDLLHMSSGVEFGETKDGQRDLNRLWIDMVWGLGPTKGTINSIVQFNRRIAPPGKKYFYASIEADVLGVVLHYLLGFRSAACAATTPNTAPVISITEAPARSGRPGDSGCCHQSPCRLGPPEAGARGVISCSARSLCGEW
jgi:hypothetical protein